LKKFYQRSDTSRSALFWDLTQRRGVIPYRRFETTYRPRLERSRSLLGLLYPWKWYRQVVPKRRCGISPSTLRNIPEECRSHLHRGGSL